MIVRLIMVWCWMVFFMVMGVDLIGFGFGV